MGAILDMFRVKLGSVAAHVVMVLTLAVYSSYGGGCTFPEGWSGTWFQSGYPGLITINTTHIHSKGECTETDSNDKFLVYERNEDCYRCMVIHEKHKYVLQFKETYCSQKDSLSSLCESITGDAPLFSMFRKEPRPVPQPCPFHPAPFTFSYNRGTGDCSSPASRAEACTDDSRLLLRYMACTDVPSTESNVEELVCLATWKEGSTRYLVGQLQQVQRRNTIASDEDTYRCFIYKGQHGDKGMSYNIAQSGDATCNGLASPTDGSRTMKLTTSDDEHNRCHFPSWIVDHHKWFSLDHTHQYHFTTKNATLKIMKMDGSFEEKRLVCHSILEHRDKQHIKLVAHVTRGCESGHACLKLYRRSGGVLELQQGAALWDAPQDACADPRPQPYVTLISTNLPPTRCPAALAGRYSVRAATHHAERRTRRQNALEGSVSPGGGVGGVDDGSPGGDTAECAGAGGEFVSASVGCGRRDTMEFTSACATTVYTCYGSWRERGVGYVVAARPSPRPATFCFMYTTTTPNTNDSTTSVGTLGVDSSESVGVGVGVGVGGVTLWSVGGACERSVRPARRDGYKAYNLTINGTCEQSSKYNSDSYRVRAAPGAALVLVALALAR